MLFLIIANARPHHLHCRTQRQRLRPPHSHSPLSSGLSAMRIQYAPRPCGQSSKAAKQQSGKAAIQPSIYIQGPVPPPSSLPISMLSVPPSVPPSFSPTTFPTINDQRRRPPLHRDGAVVIPHKGTPHTDPAPHTALGDFHNQFHRRSQRRQCGRQFTQRIVVGRVATWEGNRELG